MLNSAIQFLVASVSRIAYTPIVPNDLIAVIKQKQAAIAKLEAELDEARALLSGEAIKAAGRPTPSRAFKGRVPHKGRSVLVGVSGVLPTSSVGRAIDALREAGKPLHVTEILRRIEAQHGEKVNKTTLVGNLSRYIKAKKMFYRAGPNVFGLIEMRKG